MLTQHYSAQQRRALNQIWAAAGRYDFEPPFLALRDGKSPDLYMNCIVGCIWRQYGGDAPKALFAAWAGDRRQALLDDLAWLALESAAYARELPERPVLEALRKAHAEAFLDREHSLSRQEWMAKNQLSYTMQAARWRAVLGKRPPVMTPYERNLFRALSPGDTEDGALFQSILDAFSEARLFSGRPRAASPLRLHFSGRWAGVLTKLSRSEIVHTDVAEAGRSAGGGGDGAELNVRRAVLRLNENPETDRAYIESCFGASLLSPQELSAAEQQLCTGNHLGLHLWFTAGVPDPESARSPEARRLAEQARLQCRRNRDAFSRDGGLYQNAILRLTEQIRSCLQVHSQSETESARCGRLNSPRAWRAEALSDGRVFLRSADTARPGFSVDLMLDASSSRLHCQEVISAQGYILSESLQRCGIPVRVSGFSSLRGYTILRVFKDYSDRAGSRNIFRYFASGWNRDGLALRAAGRLLANAPEPRRLLLLLTDAGPNDSHRIPPGRDAPLGRDYAGGPAVEDTAREVRALRLQGIRVAAIFMGPSINIPDAGTIYGNGLARIRSMDQLASAAGALIRNEIRELDTLV